MPLKSYGVLVAQAVDRRREGAPDDTPHYQIHLVDDDGTAWRAAVNVLSQQAPSELLYLAMEDFRHPVTARLSALSSGWHSLPSGPAGGGLDYVRGNLFDPGRMRPLPPEVTGPDNDLADALDHYVERALGDPRALLYVFGERWGPEGTQDKVFGFRPGNGVHDVHMNQGNSARFRRDDGVWQDGGLLLHLPGEDRWVAVFLAFQSQAWHTHDTTGHALDVTDPSSRAPAAVRIVAALVNPRGPGPEAETVTLLNLSPDPVDLTGWRLVDRLKQASPIPAGALPAGATLTVHTAGGMQLGNKGGTITLLDHHGVKVHGVSYTGQQAEPEGWTVPF